MMGGIAWRDLWRATGLHICMIDRGVKSITGLSAYLGISKATPHRIPARQVVFYNPYRKRVF